MKLRGGIALLIIPVKVGRRICEQKDCLRAALTRGKKKGVGTKCVGRGRFAGPHLGWEEKSFGKKKQKVSVNTKGGSARKGGGCQQGIVNASEG